MLPRSAESLRDGLLTIVLIGVPEDGSDTLFAAAGETRTVVAAAAFRALSDMSAFDAQINARRLDSMLAACAGGHSAAPAARAMAVQLCGERRVNSARPALERILASPDSPEILRRSASRALALLK